MDIIERNNDHVPKSTLDFIVVRRRGREGPKMTWRRQVVEQVGLKKNNAIDRPKWLNAVYKL